MEMRDWQTASSLVASLLEEDPNDTAALMGKGALLIVEGETDRGIEVLKTIIGRLEDRGDLAAVYSNMGIASRIQGKYPAAIEYYRQSLAYRDKPVVLLNLAVAYEKSGSKLKAKKCFEAFVDRYPDHPQKALVVERLRRY